MSSSQACLAQHRPHARARDHLACRDGGAAALVFMMGMNNGLAELMVSNSVG